MGTDTIAHLLATRESRTHERKRDLSSLGGVLKTIVAFANTAGGTMVVGQEDDGTVLGLQNVGKETDRLANSVRDRISPSLLPDIDVFEHEGMWLLRIGVAQTPGPFYLSANGPESGIYIRLASQSHVASPEEVERLRREAEAVAFDLRPCLGSQESDLDLDAVKGAFATVEREVDRPLLETLNLLVRLGDQALPSIGGMVLFGKPTARTRYFPQAQVLCARFVGSTKSEFLDNLDIGGTVLDALLGKAFQSFVRRNTRTMPQFVGMVPGVIPADSVYPGFARADIAEYPAVAIREALVNAVAHADYSQRGMAIRVAIFSDRLEIESPGDLPTGLRLEDLKAGISRIRNPVITRVLKELGLMEQWGSGFRRMREACEEGGYPVPKWEELGTVTRVVFSPHPQVSAEGKAPSRHQAGTKLAPSRNQVGGKILLGQAESEILGLAMTPRTLVFLLGSTGYSDRTKFRRKHIKPLLEEGLLAMTIPDKPKSPLQKYKTTPKGLLALEETQDRPNSEPTPAAEDPPPPNTNQD